MIDNIKNKIISGTVLVGFLTGVAYAGAKQNLDNIRKHVIKNPTRIWDTSINGSPTFKSYELTKKNITVETSKHATLFKLPTKKSLVYACDHENDGDLDRILILGGKKISKADDLFAKQECLSKASLDSQVEMNDMFQEIKGKNAYNTRMTLDVNKDKYHNFENGTTNNFPKAKTYAQNYYKKVLKATKQRLR